MKSFKSYVREGKRGLWDNIHAKRKRGEKMRKPGDPGAPTDQDFKNAQKESVEQIDEISDTKKRDYLDKAVDNHYKMFTGRAKTSKHKLDKRRAMIQKTAKKVTGKKHFTDLDGADYNAKDRNFKYSGK